MAINAGFLIKCALLVGTSTGFMPVKAADNHNKWNIVIFLADDLGYGDLAWYSNPIIKSPNIDRFSSEGVLLTEFAGEWHLSTMEKTSGNEPGPGEQGLDYWIGITHNHFKGPLISGCLKWPCERGKIFCLDGYL